MAAVSQKSSDNPWGDLPPESTEFGFPLYLNLTEYDAMSDEWYRTEDSVSEALSQWCEENLIGNELNGYVHLSDETQIYINGGLIEEIYWDAGNYYMTGSKLPFEEVYVTSWGYMAGSGAKLPPSDGIETTLSFPLYIYFDYCEDMAWVGKFCEVNGDFSELHRYLSECCKVCGENEYDLYVLTGESLSKIGEIYIEDEPLTYVSWSVAYGLEFNTETYLGVISHNNINADTM